MFTSHCPELHCFLNRDPSFLNVLILQHFINMKDLCYFWLIYDLLTPDTGKDRKKERVPGSEESPDQPRNAQDSWTVLIAAKSSMLARTVCGNFTRRYRRSEVGEIIKRQDERTFVALFCFLHLSQSRKIQQLWADRHRQEETCLFSAALWGGEGAGESVCMGDSLIYWHCLEWQVRDDSNSQTCFQ